MYTANELRNAENRGRWFVADRPGEISAAIETGEWWAGNLVDDSEIDLQLITVVPVTCAANGRVVYGVDIYEAPNGMIYYSEEIVDAAWEIISEYGADEDWVITRDDNDAVVNLDADNCRKCDAPRPEFWPRVAD